MQVVLLAAGNSTRFVPFNKDFAHKSLVPILGKTIIEHTVSSIVKAGIKNIVIVVGQNSEIENTLGDGSRLKANITYVVLKEALGMGAAILAAKDNLEDKFFVLNSYHLEFNEFADEMQKKQLTNETVVLLGKKDGDNASYGFMQYKREKVTSIVEKPSETLPEALRIVGIYLLNKKFIETLKEIPLEHYHFERALDKYAKENEVKYFETDKKTLTLKYVWDIFAIKDYLLESLSNFISPDSKISKNAEITGNVYVSEGVKVMEGAKIKGPVFIGKGAYIGTNSLIRNGSVIGESAVVGSFLELKNVILMNNSTTHTGVIEDSIIGKNCKIAAGIVTANVRLDRKPISTVVKEQKISTGLSSLGVILGNNVNLGVKVSTMPGVIIGSNSIIGPSTVVMKNIPENTKYYTRFKEIVEETKTNEEK